MTFAPEKKPEAGRIKRNYALTPEVIEALAELTEAYSSTPGRVIEALVTTYGPSLLREAKR